MFFFSYTYVDGFRLNEHQFSTNESIKMKQIRAEEIKSEENEYLGNIVDLQFCISLDQQHKTKEEWMTE